MSQSVTFKCPNCGAYMEYDPQNHRMKCPFCGGEFTEEELHQASGDKEEQARQSAAHSEPAFNGEGLRTYRCQNCGAEIVTDDTTAATRCYFCHSPVVLSDRLSEAFRPDSVIPFEITREEAEKKFGEFLAGKKFVDRAFFAPEQMESFSGVYYPYWIGEVSTHASFTGQGERVSTRDRGRFIETTTQYYSVHREADLTFPGMFRKALEKNDRKLTDGIFPYDMTKMKPFAMGYLSGFLAEKRDVEMQTAADDMLTEASAAADTIISRAEHYDRLSGHSSLSDKKRDMKYVLLPTWVLTYKAGRDGVPYYYMMNGQTGAVCGKLPVDRKKLLLRAVLIGAAVFAAFCLGGGFLW